VSIKKHIDYIEIPSTDIAQTKAFFARLLGWEFVDYGPDYCSFNDGRLNGGFYLADATMSRASGSALIVFYATDLEAARDRVGEAGGKIIEDIFSFPGGRRFHFAEPNGSEFAIWSDK